MDPQVYVNRVLRLVKLDTTVFEDMRDDPNGTIPAVVIALISFFIAGIGGWLWWVISGYGDGGKIFLESAVVGAVAGTVLWAVAVLVAYLLLTGVFHYTANFERMLRASSLSTVPLALGLLMFIPGINLGVGIAAFGLFFLLMDIGIQVSVDAQPGHVILATFVGFVVFCLILSVLVQTDNAFAPNVFLFRTPANGLANLNSAFGSAKSPNFNAILNNAFKNAANGR